MSLRIAHISDLHFFSLPKTIKGFLGLNGLGVLNHALFRRKFFHSHLFEDLLHEILLQNIDEVWISGDLTVSGLEEEFIEAKNELKKLFDSNLKIRVIPGNHDLRSNGKKTFSSLFQQDTGHELVETISLNTHWDLITIDASHNEKKRDSGAFTEEIEALLITHLKNSTKSQVAILCHYPPPIAEGKQNRLVRGRALEEVLLNHSKVALFAHGHTHRQTLFQLSGTVVANPGISRGTYGRYNLYQLQETSVKAELRRIKSRHESQNWINEQVFHKELES
ncbi:MAG: metallophosphoesterase family protein [Chlamydiia bacterium]